MTEDPDFYLHMLVGALIAFAGYWVGALVTYNITRRK